MVLAGAIFSMQTLADTACEGRVFAEVQNTGGYEIDLINHIKVDGSKDISKKYERWRNALTLSWCFEDLWHARESIRGMTQSQAFKILPYCSNSVSIIGISPLAMDMEMRLKNLACSNTWRSLVDSSQFNVKLKMQTRGEKGCGFYDERELIRDLSSEIYSVTSCAPRRN